MREVLQKAVELYGDKTAFVFKEQIISFQGLNERVLKLSNVLRAQGIGKGDKVGIYLPNSIEYALSYLAVFTLGAVGVPLDFMLKEEELVSCLGHSETKVLIAKTKKDLSLLSIKARVPSLSQIICCGEQIQDAADFDSLMESSNAEEIDIDVHDDDPALIMYTSGTTGKPKGILLTYKHLEGSPTAMRHFVELTDKDIKICPIPFSHIGGFIYIQNCITFGITLIIMERFNPFEFLGLVQQYKVTCFHIVPPMYNAILTLKEIERFDLSSLRWVVVFGAPSSPDIMERFHRFCPNAKLLNGWGMTETCPPNTVTPLDSDNIASIGKPAPHCQIRIMNDEGQEVATGDIGEIVISGWIVMKEYYKDPEATAAMLKPEGLLTGDLGRVDEEGFLYIVGRKKEMIKVGGQIVYAPEVEAALYKHEDVTEAAVIGVSDKMKGEVVKAFVVLKEGSLLASEDIRYSMRQHLANFKVPQVVELRDSLPKNRTGKIDKAALQN